MSRLTDQAHFKEVLPWAKGFAKGQGQTSLAPEHFLLAAAYLTREGKIGFEPSLEAPLKQLACVESLPEPGQLRLHEEKMPLAAALRESLALHAESSFEEWMLALLASKTSESTGTQPPQRTAASRSSEATDDPDPNDPDLQVLAPWFFSAMSVLGEAAVSLRAVSSAVLSALHHQALADRPAIRHFAQGHADDLQFWLEHSGQGPVLVQLESTATSRTLAPNEEMAEEIKRLKASASTEGASLFPTIAWQWVQAAVSSANRYSRELQVAYHEAGHAVAIHALLPEAVYDKITIQPSGSSSGFVSRVLNESFRMVYQWSLECDMEAAVIALAGRAAEERRYGKSRSDSGAMADMAQATQTCWMAITRHGLDPVFGMILPASVMEKDDKAGHMPLAPTGWLNDLAQQRLHVWLQWAKTEADALVAHHWTQVEQLAHTLMRQKTLDNASARGVLINSESTGPYQLRPIPVDRTAPQSSAR